MMLIQAFLHLCQCRLWPLYTIIFMVKGIEMVKYSSNNNTHNESQSRLFVSHFERTSPVNIIPHTYVLIYYYVFLMFVR